MIIFYARGGPLEKFHPRMLPLLRNGLISYHFRSNSLEEYYLRGGRPEPMENLILDSGAFSAWNNNAQINLKEYIAYCLKYLDAITYVVNLDIIPAQPGQKKISAEEIEYSASEGWHNAEKMLRAGIPKSKLIHVFHQGEDFKWLQRIVDKFEYIGLSPANDRTIQEKKAWLDSCMPYVTDSKGFPIIKFHGFAVTAYTLMERYPWFSVDSATYTQQAGRGVIYIPKYKNGRWMYADMPFMVRIGFNSVYEKGMDHFENCPLGQQQRFLQYLQEKDIPLGISSCQQVEKKKGGRNSIGVCQMRDGCLHKTEDSEQICAEVVVQQGVCNMHPWRTLCNAETLNEYEKTIVPWPKKAFNKESLAFQFEL